MLLYMLYVIVEAAMVVQLSITISDPRDQFLWTMGTTVALGLKMTFPKPSSCKYFQPKHIWTCQYVCF